MPYCRLKPNHPAHSALNDLFEKMAEMDITIHIGGYGELSITHKGETFSLMDLETPANDASRYPISALPPSMEYKLIYEREPCEHQP